jgi:hypothetical protein
MDGGEDAASPKASVLLILPASPFFAATKERRLRQASDRRFAPLLDELGRTRGKRNSGAKMRFSLIEITETDFALIRDG